MPYDIVDVRLLDLETPRTADDLAEVFARHWRAPKRHVPSGEASDALGGTGRENVHTPNPTDAQAN